METNGHSPINLSTEITINGVKFIPIIELFKIGAYRFWNDEAHYNFTSLEIIECKENNMKFKHDQNIVIFKFENNSFSLFKVEPKYEIFNVGNQLDLFNKLKEWNLIK